MINVNKNNNISTNSNDNLNFNNNVNANTNANNATATTTASAGAQAVSTVATGATGGNAVGQGGTAGASTNVRVGGDNATAASAAPVYLTTSNDTCMGSSGAGGQGTRFGFSVGTTWTDENCVMLKNAREMKNQGYDGAAKIRLCMDEDNAIAFAAAGVPCPQILNTARTAAALVKEGGYGAAAPTTGETHTTDRKGSATAGNTGDSTASTAGAAPPAAIAAFMLDSGNKVYFDFDRSDLKPKARDTLDKQAAWLKEHEHVRALVEGHCDERGSRKYNLALGERRANAVKQYLISKGVAADRIDTVSYGKVRPAVAESNEAAWSQNRRAVTHILPPKKAAEKVSRLPGQPDGAQQASVGETERGVTEPEFFHSALADVTNGAE